MKLSNSILYFFAFFLFYGCSSEWDIQNPYDEVNWLENKQFKGHFHTHTTRSDGHMNPHTVVDKNHELGYTILAITDHNEVTFPWTNFSEMTPSTTSIQRIEKGFQPMSENLNYENRDPKELGFIAIQGNELSRHHHMGSFFNNHNGTTTEVESLEATATKNGLTILFHPGRYNKTFEWYVELFQQYDHLIGLEIYNLGDRYPNDRQLWVSILQKIMPERTVWGFSNDDMHEPPHIGKNWNVLILSELTENAVRYGMEKGQFFFVHVPSRHNGPQAPIIKSIDVNRKKGIIEIKDSDFNTVKWISNGEVVQEGTSIILNQIEQSLVYVRAKLYGFGGTITGTQPFGLKKKN